MDKFSWTIFITNLRDNPTVFTEAQFKEKLLYLSPEDVQEIFDALHNEPVDLETSKHIIRLLQILWHYQ